MAGLKILLPLLTIQLLQAKAHYVDELLSHLERNGNAQTYDLHPDALLSIDKFLKKYNYPLESHEVITEDGYILTLHRIPHGRKEENYIKEDPQGPKPAVFMMHGLLSSSIDFVNKGPSDALALLLADVGYDVWLGNSRGNTWSRKHEVLDPDDANSTFFDFSFHEMGVYDIPASIDYILKETGAANLSYVGYSQGTTQYFVFGSEKPEYSDKINVMLGLAPVAYLNGTAHPLINLLRGYFDQVFGILAERNIVELLKHNALLSDIIVRTVCASEEYGFICGIVVGLFGGFDTEQWDSSFVTVIGSNMPAGVSVKQLEHFAQGVTYGEFRRFDYGEEKNLEIYGSAIPPDYDLSQITTNVVLFSAENDWFAGPKDVTRLESELKNVQRYIVPFEKFSHIDFVYAKYIYSLLNFNAVNVLNEVNGLPPVVTPSTTTANDVTTSNPNE